MRYKKALQGVHEYYLDETLLNQGVMEHFNELKEERMRLFYQEKFEYACKILRTILPLKNLTVPPSFKIKLSEISGVSTNPLTIEEHVENINSMIADRKRLLVNMQSLFKGTAKSSENDVMVQIEALKWCRQNIIEGVIVL
jgi:hypothetical protein